MHSINVLVLSVAAFGLYSAGKSEGKKVVCYVGTWANYRQGDGKFLIEDIDPFLCTHVVYAFAKLEGNRIASYDPYLDLKENWGLGAFERLAALKSKNPNLKTLIAIGGWNEGSIKYSNMAASPETRQIFAQSCVEFLRKYNFDGLDVDWEYPAMRGGSPADKSNFVSLLQDLREAFKPHGFLLTAAVAAGQATVDRAYDIPGISRYLDFINLMTYDFHGSEEPATGHNAPLTARPGESGSESTLNVEFAVKYWLQKGAPPEKLVLGMPLYGRSFTLQDPNRNGVGSPSSGKGISGPYTGEPGYLGYNEICAMLNSDGSWKVVFDESQKVPYTFNGNKWITYDNVRSIALKVELVKQLNLGGGMVWSMETDDFKGKCNEGRYPLLNTIKNNLEGNEPKVTRTTKTEGPVTRSRPLTTRKQEQKTPSPTEATTNPDGPCKEPGFFPHPKSCKKFINCVKKYPSGFIVYEFDCAPGTVFSKKINACTYPYEVPECQE